MRFPFCPSKLRRMELVPGQGRVGCARGRNKVEPARMLLRAGSLPTGAGAGGLGERRPRVDGTVTGDNRREN
jgi:hypothetical protein